MTSAPLPAGAVVVGVDGSEYASHAIDWAAHHAACEHRPLLIAHGKGGRVAGDEVLDRGLARVRSRYPALQVTTTSSAADARDLLRDLSRTADVVVVGSCGSTGARGIRLGSVSTALTRRSHSPVVVVRPSTRLARGRGVVVAVDGTERAVSTLEFGFQAASWQFSPLTVVHCIPGTADLPADTDADAVPDDLRLLLSECMAGLREKYPDVDVRVDLAHGEVAPTLLDLARRADLLVVGAPTRSAEEDVQLGSMAVTAVERAECAVAVVPHV